MSASPTTYTSAYGNGNGNGNSTSDPRKRKRAREDVEEGNSSVDTFNVSLENNGRYSSPPAAVNSPIDGRNQPTYASSYGRVGSAAVASTSASTSAGAGAGVGAGLKQEDANRSMNVRTSASPGPGPGPSSASAGHSAPSPIQTQSQRPQQQQQQQQQAGQGQVKKKNGTRPINKDTLEPSYFVVEPNDEFTREVGDWIWGWIANRTDVEIEGKIGILVDNRPGLPPKTRVSFPLATETILTDTTFARFESNMSLRQHHHFNQILNMRATEAAQPSYEGAPIRYLHTKEIDAFYPPSSIPNSSSSNNNGGTKARVRVTRDQKTGQIKNDPKACVRKSRIADMNIYSPKRGFDFRISVNVEEPAPHPATKPTHERWKDRVSYQHQAFQIDLTQVRSTEGKELLHELEIEFSDMPLLMQEGEKAARGEESLYYDLVQVFLNNIRMLVRNASPP